MDATTFFFFSYRMQVLIYDNLIKLCQNIRPKKKNLFWISTFQIQLKGQDMSAPALEAIWAIFI